MFPQSLKLLRTSEFLPYVVFLQSPEFEVLKAMNTSAVEAGVVEKALTVGDRCRVGPDVSRVGKSFHIPHQKVTVDSGFLEHFCPENEMNSESKAEAL